MTKSCHDFFDGKKDHELCILKIESDEELQTVVKAFWILFQVDRRIRLEEKLSGADRLKNPAQNSELAENLVG